MRRSPQRPCEARAGQHHAGGRLLSAGRAGIGPRASHLPGVGFTVIFSRHYVFKQLSSSNSVKTGKVFMLKKKKKLGIHRCAPVFT